MYIYVQDFTFMMYEISKIQRIHNILCRLTLKQTSLCYFLLFHNYVEIFFEYMYTYVHLTRLFSFFFFFLIVRVFNVNYKPTRCMPIIAKIIPLSFFFFFFSLHPFPSFLKSLQPNTL